MCLPVSAYPPPFNVTRASHVVLHVRDLDVSRQFYTEVIGLIVTAQEANTLYLRGLEEACHHSLTLRQGGNGYACSQIGMRVYTDGDLDAARDWFAAHDCHTAWTQIPHQGRTLQIVDPLGLPVEFCATMPIEPRLLTRFDLYRGGAAQRLDHYQILTPDVRAACSFWMAAGFRMTEYIAPRGGEELSGAFLQRKGNPHDLVFFKGAGPRFHHLAYTSPDTHTLFRACDVAGCLGYGSSVERGPGRHGPGHAAFVYFRDPDGHRVELFNTHYQIMDIEIEPVWWDPADAKKALPWGLPAQRSWFEQATPFLDATLRQPATQPQPATLEKYLAASD